MKNSSPLNIAFLWHFHQPYYKNARGAYKLPWTRLYASKDYLDLMLLFHEYPQVKHTVNIVPSLLRQLEDYSKHHATDLIRILSEMPAESLSTDQKRSILHQFFKANPQHMIRPYPRYYQLYKRYRHGSVDQALEDFNINDFRDLQIWFNLTWIGPISQKSEPIRRLIAVGEYFEESDKKILFAEIEKIMKRIVPTFLEMRLQGQLRFTTSAIHYPVLPLLIPDSKGETGVSWPYPEDAEQQIHLGQQEFTRIMGFSTNGFFPPEGALSENSAQLIARQRYIWTIADQLSLPNGSFSRSSRNKHHHPFRFHGRNHSLILFFRDQYLSNAISSTYAKMDSDEAVDDFIGRLRKIRASIMRTDDKEALRHHLVTIALPGEHIWEHYPKNGHEFLSKLLQRLSNDRLLSSTTFDDFLNLHPTLINLYKLKTGDWRSGSLHRWFGTANHERAWQLIRSAREFLCDIEQMGIIPQKTLDKAWDQYFVSQGADWLETYGHNANWPGDVDFDELFRQHLMRVYEICGMEVPGTLFQPLREQRVQKITGNNPRNFVRPVIDGKKTHFYEWTGAAEFYPGQSPYASTDRSSRLIKAIYLGFNERAFFVRLDFNRSPAPLTEYVLDVKMPRQMRILISPLRGVIELNDPSNLNASKILLNPRFHQDQIFEGGFSFQDLELNSGETFGFQLHILENGEVKEIFPTARIIELAVPDQYYENREWSV